MPPVPSITTISLLWLLRLRWVALVGQAITLCVAAFGLNLSLPWPPLLTVLAVSAISNILLLALAKESSPHREWTLAGVIAADVLLLTVMIYYTGGASNPFTSFYLVLVALAAMSLRAGWLAGIVSLAAGCYLFLHFEGVSLNGPDGIGEIGCPGYGLHLQGMAVAFFLTTLCVAFFVRKMNWSLRARDAALAEAECKAARADQFSALAALAAGVAHELGSPLGTIAVASRELERTLEQQNPGSDSQEDARLIRREVERCRSILDRLDRRSTSGTGDIPEALTAAEILTGLRDALPSDVQKRLILRDRSAGVIVNLPKQPLVQSLIVLVQNAWEADTTGAAVEVEITHTGNQLCLSVQDRGPGLCAAAQKHAGEPFFTTKPPRRGMGLGLFLVRTLALQLGGELQHHSRSGGGTTATLLLPS